MVKEKSNNKTWIFLIIIAIVVFLAFILPVIPISERVSYQETVNEDNCDDDSGCVCTKKGGFLWLDCKQCTCTRYRTETRYVPLSQLVFG